MAHRKRRSAQQMMEEESLTLVRNQLPKEWVMHQYAPDYGIDFVVETFEFIDEEEQIAETLGEFFFVQMKSVDTAHRQNITVYQRHNVEKSILEDKSNAANIQVIAFPIDVNELYTIQNIGTTVPTVLFLAELSSGNIYFVCLTDYIEKILVPRNKIEENSSTVTLYIPIDNIITDKSVVQYLSFLARRSKLYGAFNKFSYQSSELQYADEPETLVKHFLSIIKGYDFWTAKTQWPMISECYKELLSIDCFYSLNDSERKKWLFQNEFSKSCYELLAGDEQLATEKQKIDHIFFKEYVLKFWSNLCTMSSIYEEFCKEWFLPTYFWEEIKQLTDSE